MKIIQHRTTETSIESRLRFKDNDNEGSYLSFPCNLDGSITTYLCDAAKVNHDFALTHPERYTPLGVTSWSWSYTVPAVGKCDCGKLVDLDGFTNTCACCGADYNSAGQRLAPRYQWGEETGEHISDILRIR